MVVPIPETKNPRRWFPCHEQLSFKDERGSPLQIKDDGETERGSVLGTTLPGLGTYNPPWLKLRETLGPSATKETKLISLAGAPPLPTLLHPA